MAILRAQAEQLVRQTGGILTAEISPSDRDDGKTILNFNFVVPALGDFRHRILTAAHVDDLPYPVVVQAAVFRSLVTFEKFLETGSILNFENRADTQDEFIDLVAKVLRSSQVVSAAQSLIARAGETLKRVKDPDRSTTHALTESAIRQALNIKEDETQEAPDRVEDPE